jgi:hypothetical protein
MLIPGQEQPGENDGDPANPYDIGFGIGGIPRKNLWFQQQLAGPQNLSNPDGTGMSPFTLPFFVPPAIPATNFNLPWSGLPPAGGFIPFTPFMLPSAYYMPMSFATNQGWPFVGNAGGGSGSGGSIDVSYTTSSGVVTITDVIQLDFQSWTIGNVVENPAGSGIITIQQPGGTGSTGNLTVNGGSTTSGSPGPLLIATGSGSAFSGNITIGLNYDTTASFDASSSNLQLQNITSTVTNAVSVPATTVVTTASVDTKGRVTAQTTRDVGLFKITKATRVSGDLWWSYTVARLRDSDISGNPIAIFPFTEYTGSALTAYNGLEADNPNSGTCYGLAVASAAGSGSISLDGTYVGFFYNPIPEGTIVIAFKEGSVNPKWWFNAANPITGECPVVP